MRLVMKCFVWEKSLYINPVQYLYFKKYLIVLNALKVQTLIMYGLIHFNGLWVLQING